MYSNKRQFDLHYWLQIKRIVVEYFLKLQILDFITMQPISRQI